MGSDKTTKFLLSAIAIGLWANLLHSAIGPAKAYGDANEFAIAGINVSLQHIGDSISSIQNGSCLNSKLC